MFYICIVSDIQESFPTCEYINLMQRCSDNRRLNIYDDFDVHFCWNKGISHFKLKKYCIWAKNDTVWLMHIKNETTPNLPKFLPVIAIMKL